MALLTFLDPFGFQSATDTLSQDIFLALAAPFYRLDKPDAPVKPATPVTVILIDDDTLEKMGTGYPLDDAKLVEILKWLVCGRAKAVFVDILLGNPRPNGNPMSKDLFLLARAKNASDLDGCQGRLARLYVADIPPPAIREEGDPAGGDGAESPVAAALRKGTLRLPVAWAGDSYAYPSRILNRDLSQDTEWQPTAGDNALPSPALQLWLDWRGTTWEAEAAHLSDLPEWFVIGWGWLPWKWPDWYSQLVPSSAPSWPPIARLLCPYPFPFEPDKASQRWAARITAFKLFIFELVPPWTSMFCDVPEGSPRQPEISLPVLPLWLFLERGGFENPLLQAAVQDRIVLLGQNVVGGSDVVTSPVHGRIPGVVVHAQALDNLVFWESNQWRLSPENASYFRVDSPWISLSYSILCVLALDIMKHCYGIGAWCRFFLVALPSLRLCSILILCFGIAPINWLWIVSLVFTGEVAAAAKEAIAGADDK